MKTARLMRSTNDFRAESEKERPGGSSFDVQWFVENTTGDSWIGKCSEGAAAEQSHRAEHREALSSMLYRLLGARTPDVALSPQKIAEKVLRNNPWLPDPQAPKLHIMSRFVQGFQSFGQKFIDVQGVPFLDDYRAKSASAPHLPYMVQHQGQKIALAGFGQCLAIACFLHDYDCLGSQTGGGNMGFVVEGGAARVVKIDAGEALLFLVSHLEDASSKHNDPRSRNFWVGMHEPTVRFEELNQYDQNEFIETAVHILKFSEESMRSLGAAIRGLDKGLSDIEIKETFDLLMCRKTLFELAYSREVCRRLQQRLMGEEARFADRASFMQPTLEERQTFETKQQTLIKYRALVDAQKFREAELAERLVQAKQIKPSLATRSNSFLFQVPERNEHFTGRETILVQMKEALAVKKVVCLSGMGGMGKTQLAAEYVHQRVKPYRNVIWLYAEWEGFILQQMKILIKEWYPDRFFDDKTPEQEWVKLFYGYLQKSASLVVFDNASTVEALKIYWPSLTTLAATPIDFIVTSRTREWPNLPLITLESFSPEETGQYVRRVLNRPQSVPDGDIVQLHNTLQGLPLALAQAVAYIRQENLSLPIYCQRFTAEPTLIAEQTDPEIRTVAITVTLALSAMQNRNPYSAPTLYATAYLAAEYILLDQLILISKLTKEAIQSAVDLLQMYSLLPEKSLRVHRLTQQVLRQHLLQRESNALLAITTGSGGKPCLTSNFNDTALMRTGSVVMAGLQQQNPGASDLERRRLWVQHGQSFLEASESTLLLKSPTLPETHRRLYERLVVVPLLIVLKGAYYDFGETYGNKQTCEQLLGIEKRHYGLNHPKVALPLVDLGSAYYALGEYHTQVKLQKEALVIQEKHCASRDPKIATTLMNLAAGYLALGQISMSKELLEKSFSYVLVPGSDMSTGQLVFLPNSNASDLASIMVNLANVYRELGVLTKSKKLSEHALSFLTSHHGSNHPRVAEVQVNLGIDYRALGDYNEAKYLLSQALPTLKHHYGPNHPTVARALVNLSSVYFFLRNFTEAKSLLHDALKIFQHNFSFKHPDLAAVLVNSAAVFQKLGDNINANALLEQALAIDSEFFGPEHPKVGITLVHLGNFYRCSARSAVAKGILERALSILDPQGSSKDYYTASALASLGITCGTLGDCVKAKSLLLRALNIYLAHYGGEDYTDVALVLRNLGKVHRVLGENTESVEVLERAEKIYEKHFGRDSDEVAFTRTELGITYIALRKLEEAKEFLESALSIFQGQHYADPQRQLFDTLRQLGLVSSLLGEQRKAKEHLTRALSILEKSNEPDDEVCKGMVLADLANTHMSSGEFESAKSLFEQALPILQHRLGSTDKMVVMASLMLGVLCAVEREAPPQKRSVSDLIERLSKRSAAQNAEDLCTSAATLENESFQALLSVLEKLPPNSRPSLNAQDADGYTPLHRAVFNNRPENAELLLFRGANPDQKDRQNKSPLDYALENHQLSLLHVFAKHFMPNTSENPALAMRKAAGEGKISFLRVLLALYPQVINETGQDSGKTALHRAAEGGHVQCVRLLLAAQASPDVRDTQGKTAAMLAKNSDVKEFLMSKNPLPQSRGKNKISTENTPLLSPSRPTIQAEYPPSPSSSERQTGCSCVIL